MFDILLFQGMPGKKGALGFAGIPGMTGYPVIYFFNITYKVN